MKFVRLRSRSTECSAFRCWLRWPMGSCRSLLSATFCTAVCWDRFVGRIQLLCFIISIVLDSQLINDSQWKCERSFRLISLINRTRFAFQPIPILFRSASSISLTVTFIVYTTYKCIVVIYISWKTKIDSQKTGIQLHKIANVLDENHFYNVCNHLSLKLLNHHLNFTACGFFDLDMATIYAISGAITSYLIILIQFNLAAFRAKPGNSTLTNNGTNYTELLTTALPVTFGPRRP